MADSKVILGAGQFGKSPLEVHAWNKDRTKVAVSQALGKVHIYSFEGGRAELQFTLDEHTGRVTGIDWCPITNQIVTCSADRNAFVWVWNEEKGEWSQALVVLRINRACTSVKWSPKGDKFAVGTGSRVVAVCYFDNEHNFWVATHVKKPIRSTVTCVAWHPNNMLIAAGGTDFKIRVFSAFISSLDKKPTEATSWGPMKKFGDMLAEFDACGWVHDVTFDVDGTRLAAVSHASQITICSLNQQPVNFAWNKLPFKSLLWLSSSQLVCAGFDFTPEVFTVNHLTLTHHATLDKLNSGKASAGGAPRAKNVFDALDKKGAGGDAGADSGGAALKSVHKNTVMNLFGLGENVFSSCSIDGQLVQWTLPPNINASMASLTI